MINEFKKFIARGNVMDLAVGVVIGGAFSSIVTSLVNDILMPIVGVVVGGVDFTNLTIKFKDATICYGNFIQNIVDFLIVAFVIFLMVKFVNRMNERAEEKMKKIKEKLGKGEEVAPEEVPAVPEDIQLLREINASLKKLNKKN